MPRDGAAWSFEWCRSWDDVWSPAFVARWSAMADASDAHVFQRPELSRAWAETCAADVQPLAGYGSNPDGARVLLPCVVRRMRGRVAVRRQLLYMGDDLFGYHDPLRAGESIDWTTLWRAVRVETAEQCDQALFRFVDGAVAPANAEPSGEESAVLHLEGFQKFDNVLASCSANHRGDVRRRRRRLAERGEVTLWIAPPSEASTALAEWRALGAPAYRQVWNKRARRNAAWRPGLDALLARVLTDGVAHGWGHFAALRVNGESIAWHVGLVDRGRLYWWIPAHRADWESFAPGKVLLAALIEHLVEARWRELHFLTGAHAYKLAWRPAARDLRVVRWHSTRLKGRLLSWYDTIRQSA